MPSENHYGNNSGVGGKFRKPPNRRAAHHSKPYDRPPPQTALRTQIGSSSRSNDGWISKLVDPAHRLITASAHRLFGSVFRKRLTQAPSAPEAPEITQEEADVFEDAVSSPKTVSPGVQEATTGGYSSKKFSNKDGITELEQILKQKTFTRSEVNRLTALLHSKSVDMPVDDEVRRSRVFAPSQSNNKVDNTATPRQENVDEYGLTSTPVARNVIDEDVASPAELAKAYMSSKTSKISPSKLISRGQAIKDNPNMLGIQHFPQTSSKMAIVPRSDVNAGVNSNGITSRFRGRSALYSMARTPYAMTNSISVSKRAGRTFSTDSGPSSSSIALPFWNDNNFSASKQGSLKRRSSALENEIGSVGPIRRIRQRHGFLSSRKLSQPVSANSRSLSGLGTGEDAVHNLPAVSRSHLSFDQDDNVPKVHRKDKDVNTGVLDSIPVSSKSSEMALKILQQLDKLSPKQKSSPVNLSTSMIDDSVKDPLQSASAETAGIKSFANHPPKYQAFQSGAGEVLFESGDRSYHNGALSSPAKEIEGKLGVSGSDSKAVLTSTTSMDCQPSVVVDPNATSNVEIFDKAISAKVTGFAFSSSSSSVNPVASSIQLTSIKESSIRSPVGFGERVGMLKESNSVSPPATFGDKVSPPKEANFSPITNKANIASSIFSFGSKIVGQAPEVSKSFVYSATETPGPNASESSITELAVNHSKSEQTADEKRKISSPLSNRTSEDVFPSAVSKSTSSAVISQFAVSVNGSLGSASPLSPASTSTNTTNGNNASGFNTGSSNSVPASSVSAFPPVSVFKFASVPSTCSDAGLGADTRPSTSFGSPHSSPLQSTQPVADTGSGSSIFGFTGPATKSSVNMSRDSTTFSFGSAVTTAVSSDKASPTDIGPASSKSMPNNIESSVSLPSFNFGGKSTSSLLGSSASGATMFSSGNPFGQNSASSIDANHGSSSSSTQPAKSSMSSPVFGSSAGFSFGQSPVASTGSVFSSSAGFAFGASSIPSTNAAPFASSTGSSVFSFTSSVPSTSSHLAFGASSTPSTSAAPFASSTGSSMFSFTSSVPSTSSHPAFGASPTGAFSSKPLGSNDQMSMEDGMAEDTIHDSAPAPSAQVLGQQTISHQSPAFVFGSSAPQSPSPFQFGSQQSSSTSIPVALPPPGGLGFNAGGGSFSLGSGGGGGDKSKRRIIKVKRGRK